MYPICILQSCFTFGVNVTLKWLWFSIYKEHSSIVCSFTYCQLAYTRFLLHICEILVKHL